MMGVPAALAVQRPLPGARLPQLARPLHLAVLLCRSGGRLLQLARPLHLAVLLCRAGGRLLQLAHSRPRPGRRSRLVQPRTLAETPGASQMQRRKAWTLPGRYP